MDQNELQKAKDTKVILDKISPSFCTVKWKHATMNLGSGAVKSCCHLPFQKIEMNNISEGLELHDTAKDRGERAMMLKGDKPKDCSYCWWIEEQGHTSDRIAWSSKSWMNPYTEEISKVASVHAKNPSWMELNFSNVCNLKCSYCSPIFSSKWLQEIKEHGPYLTDPGHNDINYLQGVELNEKFDNTELMKLFWPWFEKCYADLRLLKITGGEPFLSPHTFKILKMVIERPNKNMNLSVNSNLSVPESTWSQFMELMLQVKTQKSVEQFYLHPSIDTYGARAEYIRHGLNFKIFTDHVDEYLDKTGGNLVFICTLNNLALGGLKKFWQYILSLKQKFGPRGQWISTTSEVLMGPEWQNINILPEHFQNYITESIAFIKEHLGTDLTSFSTYELQGVERALDMMKTPNPNLLRARQNFYKFFIEHDRRRKTDILKIFPEIREFWSECSKIDLFNKLF